MHKPDTWTLLERLCDPSVSPEEKRKLETQLIGDYRLQEHLKTFRILQQWPDLESENRVMESSQAVLGRLEAEWELEAVDRELGRVFPFVAATSLAAAIIIGIINIGAMREFSNDTFDALLGLPQNSIDDIILAEL